MAIYIYTGDPARHSGQKGIALNTTGTRDANTYRQTTSFSAIISGIAGTPKAAIKRQLV